VPLLATVNAIPTPPASERDGDVCFWPIGLARVAGVASGHWGPAVVPPGIEVLCPPASAI
jgi:hypothetical protein